MRGTMPGIAMFEQGLAHQQQGRPAEAIAIYRRLTRVNQGFAPAHFNLGLLLFEAGDFAGAARAFEGAARLRPTAADAWLNLGAALEKLDRMGDAAAAYGRVVEVSPEDVRGHYSLGNARLGLGEFHDAAEAYRAGLELDPTHAGSLWNLATALLGSGNLTEGWEQYDRRWTAQNIDPAARFAFPLWQGEPVAGRKFLAWREQGLGHEILFATCLRELVAAGAEVTLAASPRLVSLFGRGLPGIRVIEDGAWGDEAFDFHAPLGGLPRYVRASRDAFPLDNRFLVADSARAARWAERLDRLGPGVKIGVSWRSGVSSLEESRQYASLEAWQPLFETPGIQWINLQYDDCRAELKAVESSLGIKIHRWPKEDLKDDLENVVALIWNLSGVVTAPTVVSSLAGSIGVRTWQVDAGGDWTAFGEPVSPWFPSIRHVRRPWGIAEWGVAFEIVASDLRVLADMECVTA